jgi:HAMP domain-containing protein
MRLKIISGNMVIVLLVGLLSYLVVRSEIVQGLTQGVDSRIINDQELFDRSWRLSAIEFLGHVSNRAATREVNAVFGALDEEARRQRANRAADAVSRWFMDPARGRSGGPDVVAVTDETGRVIARDKDINRMHGQQLARVLPTLRTVLQGAQPHHDVWFFSDENKLLQVGMAPVRNATGTVVGALVVGYDLSTGLARGEADVLGRDVAFLYEGAEGGGIYSASLPSSLVEPAGRELFGSLGARTEAALGGQTSAPWSVTLPGGESFVGVVAPLSLSPSTQVAYAIMADRGEVLALAGATNMILLFSLLGLVSALVYGFVIATSFLRPLERIEEDVLRVINGRTDVRIDVESAEFGGLAYRINQLINVFTGVSEEDAEGRVSHAPGAPGDGAWQGSAFAEAGGAAPAGGAGTDGIIDDPSVAAQLEAEAPEAYYDRLHREYTVAKQAAGEDVSSIPKERFLQRIQGNEKALAQKHGVRMVRFQVDANGSHVALRPVLIR